jgi:phosphoribosyl 1,2-cyclic phosphate phosphodiesterase
VIVTVLGTGTSHGVPMIGCECAVCTSDDPRDKRTRTSVHVAYEDGYSILVDVSPEVRVQCLANGIKRADAVLLTHHHADHIAGMDDLRRFNWIQNSEVPVYGQPETLEVVRRMFAYAFDANPAHRSSRPAISLHPIDGPFELGGHRIVPVPLLHGEMPVLGFRFGPFAYCTDVSRIPEGSVPLLAELEVLILAGLRYRPHPMHFNIEQATAWARRIGARATYLTHLTHDISHAKTSAELPDGVGLAYDGQVLRFEE